MLVPVFLSKVYFLQNVPDLRVFQALQVYFHLLAPLAVLLE